MSQVGMWEWDSINKKWVKYPLTITTKYMVAAGQVRAGAHKLYWIQCNPAAGNSVWELSDDITGLTATVLDGFHTSRESHMVQISPPMPFATGIYLKTFTNMTSLAFGYV